MFKTACGIKSMYFKLHPAAYKTGKMPGIDKVFSQIINGLGGNVEYIISGSSSLPGEVRKFLEICSGARVTVGYGLTEMSTTGLYNYCGQHFNDAYQLGYVCWETEGKLIDRSDECEFTIEKDKIGELILKGPGVGQGYVVEWGADNEKPVMRPLADKDGFYHTGDLCKLNDDGSCSFIRRVGLVVKLQHGEFLDLEKIEIALENDPLIISAVVHGEPDKSAPVCICSIDSRVLAAQMNDPNIVE